jgi:hypothetical protein
MKHLFEFSIFNRKKGKEVESNPQEQKISQMKSELDRQKLKDCGYRIGKRNIYERIYLDSENGQYVTYIYPADEDGKYRFYIKTDLHATFPPTIKRGKTTDLNKILDLLCKDYNGNLDEL